MEISVRQFNGGQVVSINGSIDALTAGEVSSFLLAQIDGDHKNLVADLSQVDFMSSAGLRVILAALKESRQQGGDLRLAAAQTGVEKVLKMSGFTTILKAFQTVKEAIDSFEPANG